jgi:uncharacterized repeat protein (TIGR01451 family)
MTVIGLGTLAQAQVVQPFNIRYQINGRGDILQIGNALSTCSTGCDRSTSGTSNNGILSQPVDVDSLGSNSSTANLTIPPGSTVLFAGLYWGSRTNAALGATTTVRWRRPGSATYATLTSDSLYKTTQTTSTGTTNPYAAFKNVTADVAASGSGTYGAGGIALDTSNDSLGGYGGWALIVVYGNPAETLRNLTVFDGLARIDGSNPVTTTISGFRTPPAGAVNARIGAVVYEGDGPIAGDSMQLIGSSTVTLTDGQNPTNNFFNSSISTLGTRFTDKNPDYVNQLGFDIDRVNAPASVIANNATSASVSFTTSGDVYFPQVLTTAIDAYVPDFSSLTKTVNDLNGGSLNPGDVLEYTLTATNNGFDNATQTVLTDPIPANTTYVPGSLVIVSGANAGTKTDASGDDQADFNAGTNTVTFRLGTGANASTGGIVATSASFTVRFRVTVNTGVAAGTLINNQATMNYRSEIDSSLSLSSAAAATSTVPVPPIDVVKSAGTPVPVSGTPNAFDVPFTINVGNRNAAGTPALPNVQVNDYVRGTFATNTPTITVSGLTATGTGGATCTANGAFNGNSDTRLLSGSNSLAPGQGCTITFTARVAYSSAANVVTTTQNNSAYASSVSGAGPNSGYTFPGGTPTAPTGSGTGTVATDTSTNGGALPGTPNGDTASPTPITFSLNPLLRGYKSVRLTSDTDSSGTITPGDTLTWTVQYINIGGTAATGVQIADTLPAGVTITAAGAQTITVSGSGTTAPKNTAYTGAGANTALLSPSTGGTLGAGGVIRIDIPVTINTGVTGVLSNQAGATGSNFSGIVSSDNVDSTTSGLPSGITVPSGSVPQTQGAGIDPTTVTVVPSPNKIDVVKSAGTPVQVGLNSFDVPYTIRVGNGSGQPTLTNVQVSENLNLTFSSGSPTITVSGLNATGVGGATCTTNASFNGTSVYGLLSGSNSLAAGQSCTITFTARVTYPNAAAVPTSAQNNTVYASSTGTGPNAGHTFPGGTPTAPAGAVATDVSSNSGSLPGTPNSDTPSPTPVTFSLNKIDTVKSVGTPSRVDPRTFDVPYTVRVGVASGQPTLTNVQVSENLNLTYSSGSPTINVSGLTATGVGGATCTASTTFNGTSNFGLLSGSDSLAAGQSCTISFTVRLTYPNASSIPATAQNNSVYASSTPSGPNAGHTFPGGTPTSPAGVVATDTSTNGASLPGTPNGDAPSPTPVTLSSPLIGTAKAASTPQRQPNGSFNIDYSVVVRNYGNVALTNVQAADDLTATFPAPTTFSVSNVAGTGSNAGFNGNSNKNLLAAGVTLNPGESRTVTFTVNVVPNGAFGPFDNSVTATGTPPTGPAVTDVSTNGSNPDPNGNGNPGDPGEDAPTRTTLASNPQIGTAKSATASAVKADGSYDVTYTVVVKNLGDITLQNVQATDNLNATFPSPATFSVSSVSGSGANSAFNGTTNQNLLAGGVNLSPGESRTITLVVNIKPGPNNFGPFDNTVRATGTPPPTAANPNPSPVTDDSVNGTNPDPNNNGRGDDDTSPTPVSFSPNPVIGTAKSASAPSLQADGSYLVTYTTVVRNYGNTVLNNVTATDNLGNTFPAPTTFSVTSVSGTGANTAFNGSSNQNLLGSGVTLNPGDSRTVTFTVRIVPNGAFGPYNNTVTATGTGPGGTTVTDQSNNGSNPNPSGDNNPNKPAENVPTPVSLSPNPVIGTAKAITSGPTLQGNGTYNITYSVVVRNYGNVALNNVQATDNLTSTFESPATFTVSNVSGTGANASFNGSSNQNLLAAGITLQPGESRTVQFTVNVTPNGNFGPFANTVIARGTAAAGPATTVTDTSNSGTDPNPSGDNQPNKPAENTPTVTSLTPNPVIGTSKSAGPAIRQANGSYNITYTTVVRNYGNTVLNGVQATDNLSNTFPTPSTFTVQSISGTDANAGFNGSTNRNLLTSNVTLNPGESRTITFTVNVVPNGQFGPFDNTVIASGTPPPTTAVPNPSPVSDVSQDGTNPDPNGNNDPTEPGENTPTRTTFNPNPVIGTAKAVGAAILQANGSYTLTYTVVVQNYGNITLENVQATDNLGLTFPGPTTFTVSNVTGSGANPGFNGSSNQNLLVSGVTLQPGESRTITYTVNVVPNGAFGPFDNVVVASGTTPSTTPGGPQTVTDVSNSGTNPNPSGDGDPTKPGENNPTRTTLTPNPVIGVAKSASAPALQPDGSYVVTYSVLIQNYGNIRLENASATDDLSATFSAPTTYTVTSVSGTSANTGFNGNTDKNLLASSVTLEPGDSRTVTFTVRIVPNGNFGPFNNSVTARGNPPGGVPVTDVSDNSNSGLNPDPNGNGDPTEPGENVPTPVTLTPRPAIGTAKAASTSAVQADGSYNITYTVLVKNLGNVVLSGVQATDDLTQTYPSPATFSVTSVSGTDANTGFNGNANKNLLAAGVSLQPGESRTITVVVNLRPGTNNFGPFNNTVLASGTPPATAANPNPTPVTDSSNNGNNPDPNGNGDATEPGENNPTPVSLSPNPVIGTAKAAGPALPQPNGSYNVTYTVIVRNYGNVTLQDAQATDDLTTTFPAPTTFTVSNVSGSGSNPGFNGSSNKNLLATGVTLQPGESRTVTFTVNVVANGFFGPFNNSVIATGTPPATPANPTPSPVSDRSTNGNNPNPSGDNDPTKPSENQPTPVSLTPNPVIGTAKAVAGAPTLNADGSFTVRFVVYVKNYGNTVLNNAQAIDDLSLTFPSPTTFTVSNISGAGANTAFNGNSDKNLLAAGTNLGIGESRRIEFSVTVKPNGNYGPFNNSVIAQGTAPAQGGNPPRTVTDRSNDDPNINPNDPTSNPNPDPNGNNDPTEIGENNPTPVPINPIPLAQNKLRLEKTVSAPVAKVGEPLGYTLKAFNDSPVAMPDLKIDDNLPYGLVYRPGSSLVNGTALEPTVTQTTDAKGRPIQRLSWTVPGVLAPGANATVQFAVNVTPVVPEGENIVNTAVATAFGGQVTSNTAAAAVKVSLGVFTSNTVIVGRVYFDTNDNNSFEADIDTPLAGARVYLSDGRYAITDDQGRYSLPDVTPGLYALRLDPLTVPYQAKPVPDDQGQRGTRYVRTPIGGGIDTEDFPLYPAKGAAVKARSTTVTRGNVTLVKALQQGGAGYAVSMTVTLSGPVSNLTITDPLPQGATRGEVTITNANGQVIRATVQDGRIVIPGVLEPGKYTISYVIFTPLPPELVITDPDINYDEVIR